MRPMGESSTAWGILTMCCGMPLPTKKLANESLKLLQLCRKRSYACPLVRCLARFWLVRFRFRCARRANQTGGNSLSYLKREDRSKRIYILLNDVHGQAGCPEVQLLHGLAEVGRTRRNGDDASVVHVFSLLKKNGSMIYGIKVEAQQASRHLPGEATGEVVNEQMDIHGDGWYNTCSDS